MAHTPLLLPDSEDVASLRRHGVTHVLSVHTGAKPVLEVSLGARGGCVARPGRGASWCQGDAVPTSCCTPRGWRRCLGTERCQIAPSAGRGVDEDHGCLLAGFGGKNSSWRPGVPGPVVLPWAGATRGQRCPAHSSAGDASSPSSAGWGFWGAPGLVVLPLPRDSLCSPWGPPSILGSHPTPSFFGAAVVLASGLGLRDEDP